ncbi:hypothetical protein ACE1OC_26340 [Streptomyces sp. DSM 116496]|uniref:hypothetical protein n=1 Tax=Streptomyces stoeckheimensis TaxID=3344656 RepID=UPI0038B2A288
MSFDGISPSSEEGVLLKDVIAADTFEHTISSTATAADQAARDRQTTLTYLMARRVTDALGCENKPLEQAPAVKSGDTQ